ncbi:TPA: hypothetical protein ACU21S_002240 [Mannheimia haemolytica]
MNWLKSKNKAVNYGNTYGKRQFNQWHFPNVGLIVHATGGRNEDSNLLAGLRNQLYAQNPEEIDYEELSKMVSEKFQKYKSMLGW